jgi:hypothetical protein
MRLIDLRGGCSYVARMSAWIRGVALVMGFALVGVAAERRALKLKVAEPVLEELMGGCSMKCSFAWSVEVVTGGKRAATKLLNDESATSAWTATAGQETPVFHFAFPKRLPKEMEAQVPFYGLDFINGHWATEEQWQQHARIRKARLLYNGELMGVLNFADSRRWQRVSFDDIMVRSGDVLTLEVLEVYPGKGGGLALSEVVLQGAH